ncbi:hypothetical protein MBLNU457_3768t1 [Dothideomycetes sp. NU457]
MGGIDFKFISDWTGQHPAIGDSKMSGTPIIKGFKGAGIGAGTDAGPLSHGIGRGNGRALGLIKAVYTATVVVLLVAFLIYTRLISGDLCRLNWIFGLGSAVARSASFDCSPSRNAAHNSAPLLRVFQVYPPVLTISPGSRLELTDGEDTNDGSIALANTNTTACSQTLVVHSFAFSYGQPYIANYEPPPCAFNRVTWNLTVVSAGRQFDRLGIVYLGDIEIVRTSTAEPTITGIEWTYLKALSQDVTNYLSLFKQPQKIIFDLGNLVDETYTAAFNVTLSASFFSTPNEASPADLILPVSAQRAAANAASVFTVPPDTASSLLTLPRNIRRAVFTVAATGQAQEEFWWSNVLQSQLNTFSQNDELYGYSPFREVQVLIDGMLAGVAWPYPVIFTGGVVPGLWRPIVGIDAFDLKEDEIDITPWLPILCDGKSHNFTILVSGLDDDGRGSTELSSTTNSYWLVTGKVFIWLDSENHITTGHDSVRDVAPPSVSVTCTTQTGVNGTNQTLSYQVNVERYLSISSTIHTSSGRQHVSWSQRLSFSNSGNYTNQGNTQTNVQDMSGYDVSSSGYSRRVQYPLYALSVYATDADNFTISATVNRGKTVEIFGQPVFPSGLESFSTAAQLQSIYPSFQGASLVTTQNGTATYVANTTSSTSFSYGTTEQDLVFAGVKEEPTQSAQDHFTAISNRVELYHRYVQAVNSTVAQDEEQLINEIIGKRHPDMENNHDFAVASSINDMIGHGPKGKGHDIHA